MGAIYQIMQLLHVSHQYFNGFRMTNLYRERDFSIKLGGDSSGLALPALSQKGRYRLPANQPGRLHRLQQNFSGRVNVPIDGDESRRRVA